MIGLVCCIDAVAADWVWPTFDTSEYQNRSTEVRTAYNFTSYKYQDSTFVDLVSKNKASYTTVEDAFVARMSAIISLDYDWWLSTLDDKSRVLALENYEKNNWDKTHWHNIWQHQFVGSKVKFIRKIEYKSYFIITYKIFRNGKDISGGFELPSAYKKKDGKWFATLDLRANRLMTLAPWVNDLSEHVETLNYR